MRRPAASRDVLILTCEHGGNRIPRAYAHLFRGAAKVLESHRGWDRGALPLARHLARALDRPLLALTWSRLLVESNRAPTNPRIWSEFTRDLPKVARDDILARWWRPHRRAVEEAVAGEIARGHRVVHVAVHSFTPMLDSEERNAEIGLLYDSRRKREARFSRAWGTSLHRIDPSLRVRYNYPYAGMADGLTTWMRRIHPEARYLGIELEINQALVDAPRWRQVQREIAQTLRAMLR